MSITEHCLSSAHADGWFYWCGVWLHSMPWETLSFERPAYIIGSARDVCLLQGLETGETTL
jgi:hypothetical protein